MALDSLPLELICLIASNLQEYKDRLSLLRGNQKLHDKVIYALYKQDQDTALDVLRWLVGKGFEQGLQHLILRNNLDVNVPIGPRSDFINTPLLIAIHWSHEKVVETLLRNGAHVNFGTDVSALELAATLGDYHITSLLLQYGAHIDLIGEGTRFSALASATKLGYTPRPYSMSSQGERWLDPPMYKSQVEFAAVIQLLLDHGADPNCRFHPNGFTPLHHIPETPWASTKEVMTLFVERGADLDTQTFDGDTPLHAALRSEAFLGDTRAQKEGVMLLLRSGADVNKRNTQNELPFGTTIENAEILKFLSEQGTSVSCEAEGGAKLLSKLLGVPLKKPRGKKRGRTKNHAINILIELLVEHGLQPDQTSSERSPLDMYAARFYPVLNSMIREKKLEKKLISTKSLPATSEKANPQRNREYYLLGNVHKENKA
ncbi:hypothetical protein N7457_008006 [Penicillium paradoxum]|uniref:uncharacterized protein n=1 Tax=Penicillium paradoxum TaxID=176176 RepID=UPI0025478C11|nr:uncharacterized protein N7457_008006 [Penicillium paradoxum]KAJ5773110.1 hypothetical protein N7457_008006 [Penicillium paradoxum]